MINSHYKTQPVAAFYALLGKTFLFILSISVVLSFLSFFIIKMSLVKSLGSEGLSELSQFTDGQAPNMMEQSKAMQVFIKKYPNVASSILLATGVFLFLFSYLFNASQLFLKNKELKLNHSLISILKPDNGFVKILFYELLFGGYLLFASGFIIIGITTNPVIGIIVAIFIVLLIVRTILFIPGVVIGEMSFLESLKYSFQTISLGRAFKIALFGFLIFMVLSFIMQAIAYFPLHWFPSNSAKMYINILIFFLQTGCISVGLTALFLRYGNFEEEKITE